jgi:hypothetical protein
MNRVTTIRAYIRPMPGMDEAAQRKAAKEAGATVFYSADERDGWLRSLRPGQVGWCWRLSWLAVANTPSGPLPIADYAHVIADLSRRIGAGAEVIIGDGAISSEDDRAWLQAVFKGALQVRSGRRISPEEMSRRGQRGARINQERAAINLLRTTHKHKLGMVRSYWKSSEYPNREARAEAINMELEAAGLPRLGSWQTIWRALKVLNK